jgi:glycosyltransferase involved in cell wall biosynthesis
MKVSIVIPALNEEKYIGKTLEAVTHIDYSDYEVIVVDNGSTDSTSNIVRTFPSVQLVQIAERGLTKAREAGRRVATGEIIAQLDADSTPPKDWLTKGTSHFVNPKIVAVSGPYFYEGGPWWFKPVAFTVQVIFYPLANVVVQALGAGGVFIGSNVFVRASALETIGGYNTEIAFYGEDSDIAKRVLPLGRIVFSPFLAITSSFRRFEKDGMAKTFYLYIKNFVYVMWNGKPATKEYENHR